MEKEAYLDIYQHRPWTHRVPIEKVRKLAAIYDTDCLTLMAEINWCNGVDRI